MVSWWPGDGNAEDIEGDNDGTLKNGATFAAGMVGQAFSFDGVDDFVEVPENGSLDFNGSFSIDLWVKPDEFPDPDYAAPMVSKYDLTQGPWFVGVSFDFMLRDGQVQFLLACGGAGGHLMYRRTGLGIIPVGEFSHVAAVYRQEIPRLEIYVNGQLQSGTNLGANCSSINQTDVPVTIGKRIKYKTELFTHGLIDEVEIFNRALEPEEIQAIYDAGSAGKCKEELRITAVGGNQQECAEMGGSYVTFTASEPTLPPGTTISWFLDPDLNNSIGSGETVTAFIPLGQTTIYAVAMTPEGITLNGSSPIEIVDTTEPEIAISFSDLRRQPVTGISGKGLNQVVVNFNATDTCDAHPSITANGGTSIASGDVVGILPATGYITLPADGFAAMVTATDASGNVAQETAVLPLAD
jgi:hypothetical protein